MAIATSSEAPVIERNCSGDALYLLGVPRDGVGVRGGLPDIGWCEVPVSNYVIGGVRGGNGFLRSVHKKRQAHKMFVDRSRISRYPVTNAQFQVFVEDGGYTERWQHCWTVDGWKWREHKGRNSPYRYGDPFDLPNHPVVGVSWYEATAFCGWLSGRLTEKLGRRVLLQLPSEAQWEKAARGDSGQLFPWGNKLTQELANYSDSLLDTTSPVGIFPKGASPYGLQDVVGNVAEWTATRWVETYQNYRPDNQLEGSELRVLRYGAFCDDAVALSCTGRTKYSPDYWDHCIGFRIAELL